MPGSRFSLSEAVVVLSDRVELQPPDVTRISAHPSSEDQPDLQCDVRGGYLERLPLALVRTGRASFAEIWHHHRGDGVETYQETKFLTRRIFPTNTDAPFHSEAIIDFIRRHGPPRILCVLGLGVSEAVLSACAGSIIIYNSIDVPALRVPPDVSRHFDLVLTASTGQDTEVGERHPDMATAMLPIGPDFASPETFFPLDGREAKRFDVIYVAAAQAYKRHDILFDALVRSPRPLRALCVMGYGEDGERLRRQAAMLGLDVEFIGPPGVSFAEVNRLMNLAHLGVVCGVEDGAPAILTEYMLAGLPVVANAELRCGLHYIVPQTGLAASAERFEHGIIEALSRTDFSPRQAVIDRWAWPRSVRSLGTILDEIPSARRSRAAPRPSMARVQA